MPLQSQELIDPRNDLLREVLRRWGRARLRVNGTSMLPSLFPYDVISLISCSANDLVAGDLAFCERAEGWLLHRVVRLEDGLVHTRGDLMPFDDAPTPAEQVIAKAVALQRFGRERPIPPVGLASRIFARTERSLGFLAAMAHAYARLRHAIAQN